MHLVSSHPVLFYIQVWVQRNCALFTCHPTILYIGDIILISSRDIIRPNLSVREGIEIVISGGMSIPQILTTNPQAIRMA
ncbi:protein LIKE COV 1-like [Quillaja saponaria]|uniref:Protein LIKE COV 1-like n=1 Tax=Quillaja saponaria TaxID=32244 RepID=A0AAD7L865_QUISA|nr:protein LIKE COV 1-like [Quillaja saponaria]